MSRENTDIKDVFVESPDYQRKKQWNASLQIRVKKDSGVLSVSTRNASEAQAAMISQQTAKSIAVVMSHYYNIKTELDMRLIDGPITKPVNNFSLILLAGSILVGILAGGLVDFFVKKIQEQSIILPRPNFTFTPFSGKATLEKIELMEVPELNISKMTETKKEAPVAVGRKAAAPDNLPVGNDFVLSAVRRSEKEVEKAEAVVSEPKTHEATEAEIKNRLNKLLGGKI